MVTLVSAQISRARKAADRNLIHLVLEVCISDTPTLLVNVQQLREGLIDSVPKEHLQRIIAPCSWSSISSGAVLMGQKCLL